MRFTNRLVCAIKVKYNPLGRPTTTGIAVYYTFLSISSYIFNSRRKRGVLYQHTNTTQRVCVAVCAYIFLCVYLSVCVCLWLLVT